MALTLVVLNDLIADLSLRISQFPITAKALPKLSYIELGPGGACNVAIMAARLGLRVIGLGEVGVDPFGLAVRDGLRAEGVDISALVHLAQTRTPVAGVVVDEATEPAYLGYPGQLQATGLAASWRTVIAGAQALFTDGWAEHEGVAAIGLEGLRAAAEADVPTFFDPGPGNPAIDNAWHREAVGLASVVLVNEEEAQRLTGEADALAAAHALLGMGCRWAVVKRGPAGCLMVTTEGMALAPGFPVAAVDATGAGDSLAAAVIYGYLHGMKLDALATLANATGAAKVQKRGTGHNMPTVAEIGAILTRFGLPASGLPLPPA
jgi:sugar/nucleoside kinase (ribokinase family)